MKIKSASRLKGGRHQPLGQQILEASAPVQRHRVKAKAKGATEAEFLDEKSASRVMKLAHEQQDEEDAPERYAGAASAAVGMMGRLGEVEERDFDDDDEIARTGAAEDGSTYLETLEVDEGDEEALKMFMAPDAPARMTLADIVMGKIKEKETEIATQMSAFGQGEEEQMSELDPKVITVYTQVGKILSTYRAGKLPKAFKIIPSLRNWEEVLYVTEPDSWSAAAMFQATKIFTSNLNAAMAQRFFNLVLLPRIRDDILDYKKLNFHLYMSLKKALFKPAAFYKGILIPMCQAGDCSLREAVIVASVLARTAIPVLHTSAAMLQLAEMPYTGANSIFLRVMLDKKYALPFRVVDAMVHHFYRFLNDDRVMPVLWHQCLLIFVQRYKEDITSEQKQALMELLRKHNHPAITDDIRREIIYSRSRDNEEPMEREPVNPAVGGMAED
eukprot:m.453828 g.453828  ORF g.453828 m.453828 type:complete len:444 (-) comp20561_c0_seq1:44-1375(-)